MLTLPLPPCGKTSNPQVKGNKVKTATNDPDPPQSELEPSSRLLSLSTSAICDSTKAGGKKTPKYGRVHSAGKAAVAWQRKWRTYSSLTVVYPLYPLYPSSLPQPSVVPAFSEQTIWLSLFSSFLEDETWIPELLPDIWTLFFLHFPLPHATAFANSLTPCNGLQNP